jgi:hypothetical protein
MATGKMKSTNVTGSADVKAVGGPATIRKVQVSYTAAGTAGTIEIRDAVSPPGDTGVLRWSVNVSGTAAGIVANADFAAHEASGLHMPDGIRVTVVSATNVSVWVLWEG